MSKRKNKKRQNPSHAAAGAPPAEAVDEPQADSKDPSLLRAIRQEPLALGIAAFIFLRPWVDGITYLSFNLYYLWFLIGLTALWGARQLMRGQTIRGIVPMSLLLLFLLIALLTGFDTVQVDKTYRSMLFWSGHALLFFLCINCLRTRAATGLVLGAFIATSLANAMFALFHFEYILPVVREAAENPAVVQEAFGMELTPDLKSRLEINRAFGNHLFPNALAAYLIMAIGCTVGLLKPALDAWRKAPDAASGDCPSPTHAGLFAWLVSGLAGIWIMARPVLVFAESLTGTQFMVLGSAIVIIAPLLIAVLSALATKKIGYPWFRSRVVMSALALALACELLALWLSFSRGGMIALAGSAVLCAILYTWGSKTGPALAKAATAATALLLVAILLGGEAGFAQDPAGGEVSPPATGSPPNDPEIGVISVSASALASTASFMARVTYWKVGLSIIQDNFWTGVGLGNFGTVYPKYQYLGAGNVQAAHNAYIQFFCETGVFGFLAFCLFWGYFALWGSRRIVREKDKNERWLLCGIYGGALAFLIHALVDFNFYNPSLTAVEFFVAAVFFARAYTGDSRRIGEEAKSLKRQVLALPVLIFVALLMGITTKVLVIDFAHSDWPDFPGSGDGVPARILEIVLENGAHMWNIDKRSAMRQRMDVRDFFLDDIPKRMSAKDPLRPIRVTSVLPLIPDIALMLSFGTIRVPAGGGSYRQLALGEAIPPNAALFITDGQKAREVAMERCEAWIESMELTDTIYPYIPGHAQSLFDWYNALHDNATNPEDRRRYALGIERWAEEGVKRSPEQAFYHRWLGEAYITRGSIETGETQIDYYRRGVQEYRVARDLYSISDVAWNQLGLVLLKMRDAYGLSSEAYAKAGLREQADRMSAKRDELKAEAEAALLESARLGNGGVLPDPLPESIANLIGRKP